MLDVSIHEGHGLDSLQKHEVYYTCDRYAAEYAYLPFKVSGVLECEYHSGYPLHYHTEGECYRYGHEDSDDDRQGFGCIQIVREAECAFTAVHLEKTECE